MSDVQALTATVRAQQKSIEQLTENIGLLVQCVAALMGEEFGTPVEEAEVETDMDGNPVK